MKVERFVSYILFLLVAVLLVAAFKNPLDTINFEAADSYFKQAHRDALIFYAVFIFIPAFMMILWNDKNKVFISNLCWLILAAAVVMTGAIIYLTYFVNPYDLGFDDYVTYSWYVVYALVALLILTIVYLVAKLFKVGQE